MPSAPSRGPDPAAREAQRFIRGWNIVEGPVALRSLSNEELRVVEKAVWRRQGSAADRGNRDLADWYEDIAFDIRTERRRRTS